METGVSRKFLFSILLLTTTIIHGYCQKEPPRKMSVKKSSLVKLRDTTFITKHDTVFFLLEHEADVIKVTENPYTKSTRFYDSLEKRSMKSRAGKNIFKLVVRKKNKKVKLLAAIVKSEGVFKPYE